MVRFRAILKAVLTAILYYSGILWLLVCMRLRRRIVVLTYHRVLPTSHHASSFSTPGIIVTPETFDLHMRFLRRHFNPVDINEFARLLRSGESPAPRTCLVTFDDGWHDNLEFALPVVQRHQVPATLFVAVDYVGTDQCFWQETLARRLFEVRHQPGAAGLFEDLGIAVTISQHPDEARNVIWKMIGELKEKRPDEVPALLAKLDVMFPVVANPGVDRFLSWEELSQLSSDGLFWVGSHGMSHTPMTRLAPDHVRNELRASRHVIQSRLGSNINSFAYPNGDSDDQVATLVRDAGYAVAFTTRRGFVTTHDDPMLLPRMNVHESVAGTKAAFLCRVLGLT